LDNVGMILLHFLSSCHRLKHPQKLKKFGFRGRPKIEIFQKNIIFWGFFRVGIYQIRILFEFGCLGNLILRNKNFLYKKIKFINYLYNLYF